MSSIYEILGPGGHETYATNIFSKIKTYLDSNPYGYSTSDEKVKQSPNSSTDAEYRILFSYTNDDTERTESAQKNPDFSFNPFKSTLSIGRTSSSGGVTTTRYTEMSIPGIDISEYVGSTLYDQLSLRKNDITLLSTWDGTHSSLKDTITYLTSQSAANKVDKAGDTMTGALQLGNGSAAIDFIFKATSASDTGDIIWRYNNNNEMMRIWAPSGFTGYARPNWRCYKSDGTLIYSGGLLTTNDYAEAATGSKLVIRHSSGYVYATYFNQNSAVDTTNMSTSSYMMFCNSDGFLRKTTRLNFAKNLTNDNIGTSSGFFVTLTSGWGRFGYANAADARTAMGAMPVAGGTFTGHVAMKDSNIFRTRLISRNDTGDSGYVNFVNTGNSAYTPVRSSGFTTMSCKHTKTNVVDISEEDALKLLDIRPVNFDYIEEVGGLKNQIGVLAEDTYNILPKVVSMPDDYVEEDFDISKGIHQSLPSVDYAKFVPYLIKMVQIQQKEIDILKSKLN